MTSRLERSDLVEPLWRSFTIIGEPSVQLLRIDSSARGTSVTRALTAAFRNSWLGRHPSGNVVRDVFSLIELTEITFIHADRHRGAAAATSRAAALTALSS